MFTYAVADGCVVLTGKGFVSAEEALESFHAIKDDPSIPDGLPWLMDLRQYDSSSMPVEELQSRVMRMLKVLGPKLGKYWAVVLDEQIQHQVKGRELQRVVQGDDAMVMLFTNMNEAKEWLSAMKDRGQR